MDLIYVIKIMYALRLHTSIKIKRNISEFIADKIIQASSESTLLAVVEKLAKLLDSDMGKIYATSGVDFLMIQKTDGLKYLNWLRQYPRIAAMIICLPKWSDIEVACEQIDVEAIEDIGGQALPQGDFDISINFTTMAPLSHGSDQKAGNATLFRRMQVLSDKGSLLNLPFYAGNAIRGEIRDLLADHFLEYIGVGVDRTNPKIAKWFFHIIYSGGGLSADSEASKYFSEKIGKFGSTRAEEIRKLRDILPFFSVLGGGLGNRILSGRINVSDFRPSCYEWGNGKKKVHELFDWLYLTRRDDFEGHEDGENEAMIANTECVKPGVKFHGGIDMSKHISCLEKSALGFGLKLLQEKGYIGADNRRGFGKVKIEYGNCPDAKMYLDFLEKEKQGILEYLKELNVFGKEEKKKDDK